MDDGYTGTNFNRPDFQRMLADMDMGYISTVIVKDSSRFGRNYLEVGQYTDYYFPENNIRFIAINDCIDSENGEDELAPFRNVMNEMMARDISRKVRSSHRLRGNAGEPLSPPPYGYMKSPENNKRWIIDAEAADVVRRVYRLCIEGKGNETIARTLQEDKVLVPMAYWQSKGLGRGGKKTQADPYKWCKSTIAKMLAQQEYCGDIINFKSTSKSFRNKTRVENPSIRFFSCSNYKGMRGTCENTHYIREDALEQIVLMELRMLADFLESAEDDFAELLEQKTNKDMIRERTTAEGALATAKARSKKLLGLFQKLYEDNVEGKVTDEWFMQLSNKYEAEQEELKRQMFELQEKLDKIDQMQTAKDDFLRAIRKFMEMQTLTPILLREVIEKIEVFPVEGKGKDRTQRVIIHYRFVGRLDIPGIIERPRFILDSRQGVAIEYLPNAI